jgi:hypothetical protein
MAFHWIVQECSIRHSTLGVQIPMKQSVSRMEKNSMLAPWIHELCCAFQVHVCGINLLLLLRCQNKWQQQQPIHRFPKKKTLRLVKFAMTKNPFLSTIADIICLSRLVIKESKITHHLYFLSNSSCIIFTSKALEDQIESNILVLSA